MGLDPNTDATAKAFAVGGSPAISAKLRRSDGGTLWGFWPHGPRLWLCVPEDERQEVRILDSRHPCGGPLAQIRLQALQSGVGDVEGNDLTGLVLGAEAPGAMPPSRESAGRPHSPEIYERKSGN